MQVVAVKKEFVTSDYLVPMCQWDKASVAFV
jgi:hypothetical protein